MPTVTGTLNKMRNEFANPVQYWLSIGNERVYLNMLLGKRLRLNYLSEIHCIQCGRKTKKSYDQGYCYPCHLKLAECDFCTVHPEKCHVEQGACPKDSWAHAQCNQPHVIYLANTSGLKVGITRTSQIPTRWIDQGATQALPVFKVQNRYQAGLVEVVFKPFVADKTNWRAMLMGDNHDLDLAVECLRLLNLAENQLSDIADRYSTQVIYPIDDATIWKFSYPIRVYPQKVTPLDLDKTPLIEGIVQGIKGQYLFFDCGVINIRKFSGYLVEVNH